MGPVNDIQRRNQGSLLENQQSYDKAYLEKYFLEGLTLFFRTHHILFYILSYAENTSAGIFYRMIINPYLKKSTIQVVNKNRKGLRRLGRRGKSPRG
jgi:hypothetical protein